MLSSYSVVMTVTCPELSKVEHKFLHDVKATDPDIAHNLLFICQARFVGHKYK